MHTPVVAGILLFAVVSAWPAEQRRGAAATGPVTFAVYVQDSAGAPLTDVKVTLSGPAARTQRTERGRIVFEGLPSGAYHFRFEKDGYDTFERDVTGRGSVPIEVKAALTKAAPPLDPVSSLPPPPARSDVRPVIIDMPAFIKKYSVGRAAGKTTRVACASGGEAQLLQANEPIAEHVHPDADEFIYVISGQGALRLGERVEPLGPDVFMMIPRGTAHVITPAVKKPLVALTVRAGEKCGG